MIYSSRPNLQIGFHGCKLDIRDELVAKPNNIKKSTSSYDWLGNGFYLWENNLKRAEQWASDKFPKDGAVVGVVYQLDHCLDFSDQEYTQLIADTFDNMENDFEQIGKELPKNKNAKKEEESFT